MKYKIGDKVRVKKDLKIKSDTDVYIPRYMMQYAGKELTIEGFFADYYSVEENCLYWEEYMLEDTPKVIIDGNKTIVNLNGKRAITICKEEDTLDKEKGVLIALVKHFGYSYYDIKEMVDRAEIETQINEDEYFFLKSIVSKYKYVARNRGDILYIFQTKPVKLGTLWYSDDYYFVNLFNDRESFKFINFKDDEPYEIEKLIEDYEKSKKLKNY